VVGARWEPQEVALGSVTRVSIHMCGKALSAESVQCPLRHRELGVAVACTGVAVACTLLPETRDRVDTPAPTGVPVHPQAAVRFGAVVPSVCAYLLSVQLLPNASHSGTPFRVNLTLWGFPHGVGPRVVAHDLGLQTRWNTTGFETRIPSLQPLPFHIVFTGPILADLRATLQQRGWAPHFCCPASVLATGGALAWLDSVTVAEAGLAVGCPAVRITDTRGLARHHTAMTASATCHYWLDTSAFRPAAATCTGVDTLVVTIPLDEAGPPSGASLVWFEAWRRGESTVLTREFAVLPQLQGAQSADWASLGGPHAICALAGCRIRTATTIPVPRWATQALGGEQGVVQIARLAAGNATLRDRLNGTRVCAGTRDGQATTLGSFYATTRVNFEFRLPSLVGVDAIVNEGAPLASLQVNTTAWKYGSDANQSSTAAWSTLAAAPGITYTLYFVDLDATPVQGTATLLASDPLRFSFTTALLYATGSVAPVLGPSRVFPTLVLADALEPGLYRLVLQTPHPAVAYTASRGTEYSATVDTAVLLADPGAQGGLYRAILRLGRAYTVTLFPPVARTLANTSCATWLQPDPTVAHLGITLALVPTLAANAMVCSLRDTYTGGVLRRAERVRVACVHWSDPAALANTDAFLVLDLTSGGELLATAPLRCGPSTRSTPTRAARRCITELPRVAYKHSETTATIDVSMRVGGKQQRRLLETEGSPARLYSATHRLATVPELSPHTTRVVPALVLVPHTGPMHFTVQVPVAIDPTTTAPDTQLPPISLKLTFIPSETTMTVFGARAKRVTDTRGLYTVEFELTEQQIATSQQVVISAVPAAWQDGVWAAVSSPPTTWLAQTTHIDFVRYIPTESSSDTPLAPEPPTERAVSRALLWGSLCAVAVSVGVVAVALYASVSGRVE
jgi:hypothetical protein